MWDNPDNGGSVSVDVLTSLVNSLSSTAALMWARIHTHTHTQGQATIDALFPNQHRKEPSVPHNSQEKSPFSNSLSYFVSFLFFPLAAVCPVTKCTASHIIHLYLIKSLRPENENGWNWNTGLKTESVHFALVLLSWFGIAKIIYFIIIYFNCSIYQYFKVVGAVL